MKFQKLLLFTDSLIKQLFPTGYQYEILGKRRSFVIHHDRLRAFQDRTIPMWIRKKRHDLISPDVADTIGTPQTMMMM